MGHGDIEAYMYQADLHCGSCISGIMGASGDPSNVEAWLDHVAFEHGINRHDEYTFDSGDFPKVVLGQSLDGGSLDHCGSCGDCLGHDLSDCETESDDMPECADYPHEPGTMYDCDRCETECFCHDLDVTGKTKCVFCALLHERHQS